MSTPSAPSSKPFSLSLSTKSSAASTVPTKRNRAAFAEDNDSDDDESARGPQAVSGFGENGAVVAATNGAKKVKKEPLVIPVQADADWRRRGGGRNLLPAEAQAAQREQTDGGKEGSMENGERKEELEQAQYGLVVKQRREGEEAPMQVDEQPEAPPQEQKTVEEQAYDRLINGEERRSNLVIPGASPSADSPNGFALSRREEPDFRTDVASRPESSTVADYEAVPIEEFGAALLRGMGWKEGGGVGRARRTAVAPKAAEKRPNLLGVGAKQTPEGLEELGAWGKGAKKGPRTREAYNPVVMRNTKTGETLTEEEKGERDRRRKDEGRAEREEKDRRDRDRDEARREKRDRDRDYDRPRHGSNRYIEDGRDSSRRHRSKSKERSRRHRSRSRDRRDYSDGDRYMEKERTRRHRDERYDDRRGHRSRRDREEEDGSSRILGQPSRAFSI